MNHILRSRIVDRFGYQWRFAKTVGIHESQVSKIVNRGYKLPKKQVPIWEEALGCDLKEVGVEVEEVEGS